SGAENRAQRVIERSLGADGDQYFVGPQAGAAQVPHPQDEPRQQDQKRSTDEIAGPCGAQSRRVLPGARANVRANRCLFQADQRLWMHRAPLRTGPSRVSARGQAVSRTVIAPLGSTILYARQNLEL